MSNKITTKSYCIKRLRDTGYTVDKLDSIVYTESDARKWTVLLDRGGMSIVITCFKNDTIHVYDGGRYTNSRMKLSTDSVEVLVDFLNSRGLIHKHPYYSTRGKTDESFTTWTG